MTASSGTRTGTRRGRSIGRLLSSGGRMALVGLLGSVATLGFTLWIQHVMARQAKVGEPLRRASIELEHNLARTFVQLHGWIAYGDEDSRTTRQKLWTEEIDPRLKVLHEAVHWVPKDEVVADVGDLEEKLRQLRFLQWYVEDVARSPSNVPASAAYENELRKIRVTVMDYLRVAAMPTQGPPGPSSDAQLLLTRFLETDRAIIELIDEGGSALAAQATRLAAGTKALADQCDADWSDARNADPRAEALVAGAREASVYVARVARIVRLRQSNRWNVSQHLFVTRLKPLQVEVSSIARKISQQQENYVRGQARGLVILSFVVLALALLMGGLSIASMYINFRLEHRVQSALAKAKSLGQYIIEDRVGGGGMGDVYRASHALLRRPSAVKVLRTEALLDPQAQARFQEEVQITSLLTHPNTIAIFDYGRTPEGLFYYAMELLNGATLNTVVSVAGPMPPPRVVHILKQICGSLQEAHTKGLLHRDIKPSNVMATELGGVFDCIKVLDFGLVTRMRDPSSIATMSNDIVGTPAYLAPEAIESEANANPRTDLYAVGAVGYFLLTGTPVFQHETVAEILNAHLEVLPEPISARLGAKIPEDLELIILGCLAKNPSDRPKTAGDLARMLDEADVAAWTTDDAELWWDQYGEAVEAEVRAGGERSTVTRSRIGVRSAVDIGESSRT